MDLTRGRAGRLSDQARRQAAAQIGSGRVLQCIASNRRRYLAAAYSGRVRFLIGENSAPCCNDSERAQCVHARPPRHRVQQA
jgi:hypothetical protein